MLPAATLDDVWRDDGRGLIQRVSSPRHDAQIQLEPITKLEARGLFEEIGRVERLAVGVLDGQHVVDVDRPVCLQLEQDQIFERRAWQKHARELHRGRSSDDLSEE